MSIYDYNINVNVTGGTGGGAGASPTTAGKSHSTRWKFQKGLAFAHGMVQVASMIGNMRPEFDKTVDKIAGAAQHGLSTAAYFAMLPMYTAIGPVGWGLAAMQGIAQLYGWIQYGQNISKKDNKEGLRTVGGRVIFYE